MVVFGGFVDGNRSNDHYEFTFETLEWKKISAEGPCPRAGHSACVKDDSMYVFGGHNEDNEKLRDLWEYTGSSWNQIEFEDDENAPFERSGHTAAVVGNNMLIFGGILEITREVNDMYSFDFGAKKWKIIFKEALKQRSNSMTNMNMSMES